MERKGKRKKGKRTHVTDSQKKKREKNSFRKKEEAHRGTPRQQTRGDSAAAGLTHLPPPRLLHEPLRVFTLKKTTPQSASNLAMPRSAYNTVTADRSVRYVRSSHARSLAPSPRLPFCQSHPKRKRTSKRAF